jgi:hypothetical protein
MYRFIIFIRFILIVFVFSIPAVTLGTALIGLKGALIGFMATLLIFFCCLFGSEWNLSRMSKAEFKIPLGLDRTLELAMKGNLFKAPHLLVYADPFPQILVARALGGRGSVFLSQGMISLLDHEELCAVLKVCIQKTREPGIIFQSFSATLAIWLLALAPKAWMELVFADRSLSRPKQKALHPLSAVRFFLLFPLAQIVHKWGSMSKMTRKAISTGEEQGSIALRKISQSVRIWGSRRSMGILSFYNAFDPY